MTTLPFGIKIPLEIAAPDQPLHSSATELNLLDVLDSIQKRYQALRGQTQKTPSHMIYDLVMPEDGLEGYIAIAMRDGGDTPSSDIAINRRKNFAFPCQAMSFRRLETQWEMMLPFIQQYHAPEEGVLVGIIVKKHLIVTLRKYDLLKGHIFLASNVTSHDQMAAFTLLDRELPGLFGSRS